MADPTSFEKDLFDGEDHSVSQFNSSMDSTKTVKRPHPGSEGVTQNVRLSDTLPNERRLGQILVSQFGLTDEQLAEALRIQREEDPPRKIGQILTQLKYVKPDDLQKAWAFQMGFPFLNELPLERIDAQLVSTIPINFAKKNELLPIEQTGNAVTVAIGNPLNHYALDELRMVFNQRVRVVVAPANVIISAINQVYDRGSDIAGQVMDGLEETDLDSISHELEEPKDLLDADDEAPIIRLVNSLLFQAIKERASDIHIEPFERSITVRFRIDGILYEIISPPKRFQSSIISRVKIMAGLNIAEKRLPQDGRIRIKIAGKDVDIRVSTIPTAFGESVVMRLLDKSNMLLKLEQIGLLGKKVATLRSLIHKSYGIVLVTGPTGAGKTTTLYSALSEINSTTKKIITVEDPIEYQLAGVNQVQINSKIDLTFAAGLRSILRQDPDVIMVGEIRDIETAEIAIQASLTGHLVFSTLHTNDSAGALTRLLDMGVEPFLVASSLLGVVAQRLVRVLCKNCAQKYSPSDEELRELGIERAQIQNAQFLKPVGCPQCVETGYSGRTGIYEMLLMDEGVRSLLMQRNDSTVIKKFAISKGMETLRIDGARKILQGQTSVAEILRVTQEETMFDE